MEKSGPSKHSYVTRYAEFISALEKMPNDLAAGGESDFLTTINFYDYYKDGSAFVLFKLGLLFHKLAAIDRIMSGYCEAQGLTLRESSFHSRVKSVETLGNPLDEAERCYRAALQLKPDFAEAAFNLAGLLQDRGNTVVAAHLFRLVAGQNGAQQAAANARLAQLEGRIEATEDGGMAAFPLDREDGSLEIRGFLARSGGTADALDYFERTATTIASPFRPEHNQRPRPPQLPQELAAAALPPETATPEPDASGMIVVNEDYRGYTALWLRGTYFLVPHYLQPLNGDDLPPPRSRLRYRLIIDRVMLLLPRPPHLLIRVLRRVWPNLVRAIAYHAIISGATEEEAETQLERRSLRPAKTE